MAQIIVEQGTLSEKQFRLGIEFISLVEGESTFYAGTVYCPVEIDVCPWKALVPYSFSFYRNYNWTATMDVQVHPYEQEQPGMNIDLDTVMEKVLAEIESYEMKNN